MTLIAKPPIPGLLFGTYPERALSSTTQPSIISSGLALWARLTGFVGNYQAKRFVQNVRHLEKGLPPIDSQAFNTALLNLKAAMRRDGFIDTHIAQAFAMINQVYANTLHIHLFDTQLIAAYYLLHNRLAEMATGEGKTYAVALAAATAGISGVPVHVITANPYLAARDAASLKALYQALGLTVGTVVEGQGTAQRQQVYACDISYCTAKELVFDYLRDSTHRNKETVAWDAKPATNQVPQLLLRGLCMAIIDEVDSILIDEASMPLILSQGLNNDTQTVDYCKQALSLAHQLIIEKDFTLQPDTMQADLTVAGCEKLEVAVSHLTAAWYNRQHREETICQALSALYLYRCDQHYLVKDGAVSIIDANTGRVSVGRTWSRNLQQLIEMKEGCQPSANQVTIAQTTYQRFFPKYFRLSGVSGTLQESRQELLNIYGMHTSRVPLRLKNQRKTRPTRLFRNHLTLSNTVVERIAQLHAHNQPILIGTESIVESELLAAALKTENLPHKVLNAKNDQHEAELVAQAGKAGAITITTNMAGRGTDIALGASVAALGGLHVINCQANMSRRVDRQLIGRCARQGDPGSAETWLSMNNNLLLKKLPLWLRVIGKRYAPYLPSIIINTVVCQLQKHEEQHQALLRKRLLKTDTILDDNFALGKVL